MTKTDTRRFTVDQSIVRHLIISQSGTVEKALLEAVANAIDAGANRVDLVLDEQGFTVADDGEGFPTEDKILACFEVFGFDHALPQNQRQIGRFGIGRGQMFAFGVNTWRTHGFRMVVDIENKGTDYMLERNLPAVPGVQIDCRFYNPLTYLQRHDIESELRELVRYCPLVVTLNGRQINEDPTQAKWDYEDDDAYYSFKRDGRMAIYSQGLLVTRHWAQTFGIGGAVVTKRGRGLTQNMARNDISEQHCPIWKRVKAVIAKHADRLVGEASRKQTLTPAMRDNLGRQLRVTPTYELANAPVFTLTNGKHVSLRALLRFPRLTTAPDRHRAADRAIQAKQAAVLSPATLARFGVDTPTELVDALCASIDHSSIRWTFAGLRNIPVFDTFEATGLDRPPTATLIDDKQLTPGQRTQLRALRRVLPALSHRINPDAVVRKLYAGESESAEGWTDGVSYIAINKEKLAPCRSPADVFRLVGVLVHELLHHTDSEQGHGHDAEFYERFHDLMLDTDVAEFAIAAFAIAAKDTVATRRVSIQQLEKLCVIDMPVGTGTLDAEPLQSVPRAA